MKNNQKSIKSFQNSAIKTSDAGRSMVEMLGVLAVAGILSIGGVMGYTMAMTNHKANEIVRDVNLRASTVTTHIIAKGSLQDDTYETDFGDTNSLGQNVAIEVSDDSFFVVVEGIDSDTCKQILVKGFSTPILIGETVATPENCSENTTMAFQFPNEVENATTTPEGCETSADCSGRSDGKSVCDTTQKVCACPNNSTWNETSGQCERPSACAQPLLDAGVSQADFTVKGNTITFSGSSLEIFSLDTDLSSCDLKLTASSVEIIDRTRTNLKLGNIETSSGSNLSISEVYIVGNITSGGSVDLKNSNVSGNVVAETSISLTNSQLGGETTAGTSLNSENSVTRDIKVGTNVNLDDSIIEGSITAGTTAILNNSVIEGNTTASSIESNNSVLNGKVYYCEKIIVDGKMYENLNDEVFQKRPASECSK